MSVSGQEDWYNIPELDPVDVTGKRGGFWNFGPPGDAGAPGSFNDPFAGITPPADEAFAPPVPTVLPEVLITAPKLAPPPPAPPPALIGPIINLITKVATPIVGLLFPQPMGPRELDEAPDAMVLPELTISAPRIPTKPPKVPVSLDPIQPPNWWELAQPREDFFNFPKRVDDLTRIAQTIDFLTGVAKVWYDLIPTRGDRPDTELVPMIAKPAPRIAPTITPTLDPFNDPIYVPKPTPRYRPAPGDRGAPRVSPDPREFIQPTTTWGNPVPDFSVDPAPGVRPQPIGDPRTLADPVFSPQPVPFQPTSPAPFTPTRPINPEQPFRPYQPDFNVGPQPGMYADPFRPPTKPPGKSDRCNCAKPSDKKKKKKKPKERDVCYRGTYRQLRKGISYNRLEEIPCEAKSKAKKAKKNPVVDSLQDLAGSIFGTSSFNVGS